MASLFKSGMEWCFLSSGCGCCQTEWNGNDIRDKDIDAHEKRCRQELENIEKFRAERASAAYCATCKLVICKCPLEPEELEEIRKRV